MNHLDVGALVLQVGVMCKAWLIHHTAMQTQYDVAQSFYADLGPSEIALYLLHAARRHFGEEVMCKLQAPVVEAFIYLLPWVRVSQPDQPETHGGLCKGCRWREARLWCELKRQSRVCF